MISVGPEGIKLIQSFEGCKLTSYLDSANVWTIGWGTTRLENGQRVRGGMTITQSYADELLRNDLNYTCQLLAGYLKVPQQQNQIDALVSFCYNLGIGSFRSSTLCKMINAGVPVTEEMFTAWNKVRQGNGMLVPLEGLTRRRKAEYALYSKHV